MHNLIYFGIINIIKLRQVFSDNTKEEVWSV